jgi:uncharacterized membrane protein HdeD (DUF308 family)
MSFRQFRLGESVSLIGAIVLVVSFTKPWYQAPIGNLDAWDTFGPAVVLLLTALCGALALVVSAVTERSTALPVSIAVWCVLLGLIGVIAAVVRVIERPEHASSLCAGPWLALAGAIAVLAGAWLTLRDERPSLYPPAVPEPRPRP